MDSLFSLIPSISDLIFPQKEFAFMSYLIYMILSFSKVSSTSLKGKIISNPFVSSLAIIYNDVDLNFGLILLRNYSKLI